MHQEFPGPEVSIYSELLRQAILPHEFGHPQKPQRCKGGLPLHILSIGGKVTTTCPNVCKGKFNWAAGAWIGPNDV